MRLSKCNREYNKKNISNKIVRSFEIKLVWFGTQIHSERMTHMLLISIDACLVIEIFIQLNSLITFENNALSFICHRFMAQTQTNTHKCCSTDRATQIPFECETKVIQSILFIRISWLLEWFIEFYVTNTWSTLPPRQHSMQWWTMHLEI